MVKIIEGWEYNRDQYQYILYHTYEKDIINIRTKETRRGTVTEVVGYYQTLGGMVRRIAKEIADDKVMSEEVATIQEHIAAMDEACKELTEIITRNSREITKKLEEESINADSNV